MAAAEEEFTRLVSKMDYPMFLVTTVGADGHKAGCLVGFATQCSIDPPRFLIALSDKNHTYRTAQTASHLGVHILDRDDTPLAQLFGGETGDEVDKFARCDWTEGPHGIPIMDEVGSWFVGRIVERVVLGDHTGHIVEPVAAHPADVEHLEFSDAKDIDAGHSA